MIDFMFFVGICVLTIGTLIGANELVAVSCAAGAEQIEVEHRYSFMGGCSYKHAETGIWVPRDNYRANAD